MTAERHEVASPDAAAASSSPHNDNEAECNVITINSQDDRGVDEARSHIETDITANKDPFMKVSKLGEYGYRSV